MKSLVGGPLSVGGLGPWTPLNPALVVKLKYELAVVEGH